MTNLDIQSRAKYQTDFHEKFALDKLTVWSNDDWTLSVRPSQITLASMVLSSKNARLSFSEMSQTEGPTMLEGFQKAEEVAKSLFQAERINILCLMLQDPIIHYHIFPRYPNTVIFQGEEWIDEAWPKPIDIPSQSTKDHITHALKGFIETRLAEQD